MGCGKVVRGCGISELLSMCSYLMTTIRLQCTSWEIIFHTVLHVGSYGHYPGDESAFTRLSVGKESDFPYLQTGGRW